MADLSELKEKAAQIKEELRQKAESLDSSKSAYEVRK